MRKIALVFSTILFVNSNICTAQNSDYDKQINQNKTIVKHLLESQSRRLQYDIRAKTTGQYAERLIAVGGYDLIDATNNGWPAKNDSAFLKYSGSRSSFFNFNTMGYDNSYSINGALPMGYVANFFTYDPNDEPTLLSDSCWIWNPDTSHTLSLIDTRYSLYDGNNNVTEYADLYLMDTTQYYPYNKFVNTFDASANISTSWCFSWNMGTWDTSMYRTFIYNSSHQLIADSTLQYDGTSWTPIFKWNYSYNSSGYPIEADCYAYDGFSSWVPQSKYILTYYSNNTIQKVENDIDTGGTWHHFVTDTFGYASGLTYANYIKEYDYYYSPYNSAIPYTWVTTKHINSTSLPDTMYYSGYDTSNTLYSRQKTSFIYDSYEEPTLATTYLFDIADNVYHTSADYINHYYYEIYQKAAGVNNIATQNVDVKIYPNPTTNTLFISQEGMMKGTRSSISIINASGQLIMSESLPWQSGIEQLSIASLMPGIYWVNIQDNKGNNICKKAFVKE